MTDPVLTGCRHVLPGRIIAGQVGRFYILLGIYPLWRSIGRSARVEAWQASNTEPGRSSISRSATGLGLRPSGRSGEWASGAAART